MDLLICTHAKGELANISSGRWEEILVTNVKKLIPDSVENFWHEWRASMKKAEQEFTGDDVVSDAVEMAGWGVEEATEKNKKDASKFQALVVFPFLSSPVYLNKFLGTCSAALYPPAYFTTRSAIIAQCKPD